MNNVMSQFINVWIHPWKSFQSVREEGEGGSIRNAAMFVIAMGILSGIIATVWAFIVPPPRVASGEISKWMTLLLLVVVPVASFAFSFVGAFILSGLVYGFTKGTSAQYKQIYRMFALLAALSPINSLLAPIPTAGYWLALVLNVWGIILLIQGVIIVTGSPAVKTWIILGILFIFLMLFGLMVRNQIEEGNFPGENNNFSAANTDTQLGGNLDEDEKALNEELKNMSNNAKQDANGTAAPAAPAAPAKK